MAEVKVEEKLETPQPEDAVDIVVTPKVVDSIVKGLGPHWTVEDFSAKLGTKLGDNFMSIIYSVSIQAKSEKNGEKKKMEIMLKTMPRNAMRVQMINECDAFVKEIKIYGEVFPEFVQFQKDQGIKEIFKPFATCYAFNLSPGGIEDYIALQDERCNNFRMACRMNGLDLEETKLVMRSLGKFHALSYAKSKGDADQLLEKYPYLIEKMFKVDSPEMQKEWFRETFARETKLLREKNPSHPKYAEEFEKVFTNDGYWTKLCRLIADASPVPVINHGDSWTNNFLFQFNPDTKKPVGFKFLDYQMSRIGSRCLDLGYFLYTSPKMNILNNHEEEVLRDYYEEFKSFAIKLGYFNPSHTFEQLLEEYDSYRLYGISMGCCLAPIISAESGQIPDLETLPEPENGVDDAFVFTEETKEMWFGALDKEDSIHSKILNIAKFHISKIK